MKIIKKYQNRRMYDVAEKNYITLSKLREMICKRIELQVIDVKSSEDITKQTLIQIILEEELLKLEKFSNKNLMNLISILSGSKSDSYNNFLQESTSHFIKIEDNKKPVQNNDDKISANKLTKFWQSITGTRNE
jgi:polyhydroxyalkanoate synthesis repressor PhaR